jgi:hypothetical protein
MRVAMDGMRLDSNEIREYTYGAFANIAGKLACVMTKHRRKDYHTPHWMHL